MNTFYICVSLVVWSLLPAVRQTLHTPILIRSRQTFFLIWNHCCKLSLCVHVVFSYRGVTSHSQPRPKTVSHAKKLAYDTTSDCMDDKPINLISMDRMELTPRDYTTMGCEPIWQRMIEWLFTFGYWFLFVKHWKRPRTIVNARAAITIQRRSMAFKYIVPNSNCKASKHFTKYNR